MLVKGKAVMMVDGEEVEAQNTGDQLSVSTVPIPAPFLQELPGLPGGRIAEMQA